MEDLGHSKTVGITTHTQLHSIQDKIRVSEKMRNGQHSSQQQRRQENLTQQF